MKIIILTKNLKTALENLSIVIDKKPTIPILAMISLRTYKLELERIGSYIEGGLPKIELIATNFDQSLKTSLTCEILEEGNGCLDAAGLLAICKKTKEQSLEIEILGKEATVKAGEVIFKLEAAEFPEFPEFPILTSDLLGSGEIEGLVCALNFVQEAISKDATKLYLNGVNLKSVGDDLDVVATDGYILLKTSLKTDLKLNCIVPSQAIKTILKVFKGNLAISYNKFKIKICGGGYELVSKLITGEFPDYQRLITKNEMAFDYEINSKKLSEAIKQIEPKEKFKAIKFKFGEKLELESKVGKTSINCAGEEFLIGFEAKQILAICKVFSNFKIGFKDDSSSMGFIKNELGVGLIMPCKI